MNRYPKRITRCRCAVLETGKSIDIANVSAIKSGAEHVFRANKSIEIEVKVNGADETNSI